ncbi:MAG TPA: glycosyltransferase family 4 protein [Candidatus Binatia bacterium]
MNMRILWVNVGGLWPLNTGGRQRSFNIIRELTKRHRVILLTTHGSGDDPAGLATHLPDCEAVRSIPFEIPKRDSVYFAGALLRSWFSSLPVNMWRWRIPALRDQVERVAQTAQIDLCVADFLYAVPNVPRLGCPTVLFNHNVEHMIWERLWRSEPRRLRRALLGIEWRKMRRAEAAACTKADLTLAVSENDCAVLSAAAPRARVRAIPTGVDTSYFHPNGTRQSAARLVFTGSMDWYPNEEAILHFIDAILPLIRRDVPEASLTVVGRNPTARLRAAAGPAVHVTGTVDDVRPYVAEAAVYVVPLRIGGGTRIKIFEALAMGKAIVSTRIGAEGLPLVPGEHFIQADDPDAFARAVVGLLRAPERRDRLGDMGRELVEERYSWKQAAREFEIKCEEVTHAG